MRTAVPRAQFSVLGVCVVLAALGVIFAVDGIRHVREAPSAYAMRPCSNVTVSAGLPVSSREIKRYIASNPPPAGVVCVQDPQAWIKQQLAVNSAVTISVDGRQVWLGFRQRPTSAGRGKK